MKLLTTVLMILLACVFLAPVQAAQEAALPSVDQVLDKYAAASGGKEAMEKITSQVSKGTIEVVTFGTSGTFEQNVKSPDRLINTSEFPGYGTVIQCVNGESGWASDPERGLRDLSGFELAAQRRAADLQGPLHLKNHYKKLSVTGKATVAAHEVYVVEAQPAQGDVEKLYFDTTSGLMSGMDVQIPEVGAWHVVLDDYRDVDGVKMPFSIKQDSSVISLVVRLQEVKNNVPIDDAKFVKPAAPKPDAPK